MWGAVRGVSALGERLVNRCPLAGRNQALWGTCLFRFTETSRSFTNRLEVLDERFYVQKQIYGQRAQPTHLQSLEMASLTGRLAGGGEDEASRRSSAGEALVGLVVANSRTN